MTSRVPSQTLAAMLACLFAAGAASGQEAPAAAGVDPPSASAGELGARLAQLEQESAELARVAAGWAASAAESERARLDAPARARALEREIAALQERPVAAAPQAASAAELEVSLLGAEQDLALARREAAALESEAAGRGERRRLLPDLLGAAKQRLATLADAPAAAAGDEPRLAEARQELAQARREAVHREVDAHEQELASFEARGSVLARLLDRAQLRIAVEQARVEALRGALVARQQREADRSAERARAVVEQAAALAPAVQDVVRHLAEQNVELAAQRTGSDGLVGRIDEVARKLAKAEESVAQVQADRARIAKKIEAAGLSGSVGVLLRKQRADAPDVGKYRRFIRMREEAIGAVQLRQIELRDERRDLADIDALVARAISDLGADLSAAERAEIEALLRDLLETKRRYLDALIADTEVYFQKLVDFDAKQQELIEKTEELLRFIDARILWIPSGSGLRPGLLADGRDGIAWLAEPRHWGQLGRTLAAVGLATPWRNAAIALALLLYIGLAGRVRTRIRELGDAARDGGRSSFAPTAEALGLTLLLVPWLPGAVGYLGLRIEGSPEATLFARCIGGGLVAAALVWATLELPRQILRAGGVAVSHLGWPAAAASRLRRDLGALAAVAVPLVLILQVFELCGEDAWKESVGRAAFALLAGVLVATGVRWLRRSGGAIAEIAGAARAPVWRWRLLQGVGVGVPALLGVAALSGYTWTALRLAVRQHWTLCFLFALVLLLQLAARWSMLARRRLATERARRGESAPEGAAAEEPGAEAAEAPLDLAAVQAQTGRLLGGATLVAGLLGLWLIWAEVLPAADILREVELWSTTRTFSVLSADAAGRPLATSEERVVPVTLADLLAAAFLAGSTLLLIRNLPGLLELSLFHRVGLGPGERYATATLAKYGIGAGGLALACDALGLGWSSIQWLVAAVGIGLGFGLQEIFANFVSGLILLFERPIRVGDIVTIGEQSGTVSRIRIRATWITGFDRKELIVPNKEFVTGKLVNWSLSDTVLRAEVPVGVAYGTDVPRALELLRQVALENADVLRDPRPEAWFLGFGESTLDLELRVFSPDVAHLLPIRHALHLAIDRAFREAGIEIAFPQRDVHVRTGTLVNVHPSEPPRTAV